MSNKTGNKHGMMWITKHRRLAIYIRDGLACVYCEKGIEQGAKLTLDHLVSRKAGGTNISRNLVTACSVCNSKRGSVRWRKFAAARVPHILRLTRRSLDVKLAKQILESRQNFREAILDSHNLIRTHINDNPNTTI